jgi:hypothetical protein
LIYRLSIRLGETADRSTAYGKQQNQPNTH